MDDGPPSTEVVGIITRASMFEPVLEADPSFLPIWTAFMEDWGDEPQPLNYLALSDLVGHLIGCLARGDTTRFDAVFDVVERWHIEGDAYVREAAYIGLLEDLQNTGLHQTTRPEDFLPWLRPVSRRWWDKVDAFWRDGAPIRTG